jgi:AAA domain
VIRKETPPSREGGAPEGSPPGKSSGFEDNASSTYLTSDGQVPPKGWERGSDLLSDDTPDLSWLVEPVATTDATGIIAAPAKGFKSWALFDLAVAIATGASWLGTFKVCRPGPVLLVVPEGGRGGLKRRLRAILDSLGDGRVSDLAVVLVRLHGVTLKDPEDIANIRAAARDVQPVAFLADSLYLALRGADPTRLVDTGDVLSRLGDLAGEAGAAAFLTHHLNRRQDAQGLDRISGAGPAEWASTLLVGKPSAALSVGGVTSRAVRYDLTARETPELSFEVRWSISSPDPSDLSSPLDYHVEVELNPSDEAPAEGLSFVHRRVFDAIRSFGSVGATVRDIGDGLVADGRGKPLRRETTTRVLNELVEAGLIDGTDGRWWVLETAPTQTTFGGED